MSFFRLRTIAGNHWPGLPDGSLSQVWSAYLTLDRTQWLDRAEIERHQLSQLRALLEHCQTHVRYYRELLAVHGIAADSIQTLDDLRRLPLLERRTWQDRFDDFCAELLPPGTVALDEERTSGTSGLPIRILQTNVVCLWWLAFYLRDLEWSGLDPTRSMASIRATLATGGELERLMAGERFASWHPALETLIEMGPLYGMDIRQDPHHQLAWLRALDPEYLLSHTSNLELLAGMLLDAPRRFPNLRAVQAISETLTASSQARIEAAFGVPVKNLYSCAEAGYIASPCPAGGGLHVHAENAIVEILDNADRPVAAGETGRVILTVLQNFLTPLIRYEIGDTATLGPAPCPCGRGLPLLMQVHGKQRPMFALPDGRRKHASGLVQAISQVGGHYQHQAVQTSVNHVIVRIVPDKTWDGRHAHLLREAVQRFFEAAVSVEIELCERLQPSPGGKVQGMLCLVSGNNAALSDGGALHRLTPASACT
jgi:phenylacetate-CoA ligase